MEHKETKKICILVGLGAVLISSNAFAAIDGSTTTPTPPALRKARLSWPKSV